MHSQKICRPKVLALCDSSTRVHRHAQSCRSRKPVPKQVESTQRHSGSLRSDLHSVRPFQSRNTAFRVLRSQSTVVCNASEEPSIQLATAKLPKQIDEKKFADNMYQWAATLTSSGQNMPFSLPLRIKKLDSGFEMSLLRINQGEPVAVAHIRAEVEDEPSVGNIFFVRFFEGPGSQLVRSSKLPEDPQKRLKLIVDGIVDMSTIMRTMQAAIKETAGRSVKPRQQ